MEGVTKGGREGGRGRSENPGALEQRRNMQIRHWRYYEEIAIRRLPMERETAIINQTVRLKIPKVKQL
jgi:hypothetical protein